MAHLLDELKGFRVLGFTSDGTPVVGVIGEVDDSGAYIDLGIQAYFCPWGSVWFLDESVFFVGAQVIQLVHPFPRGEVTYIDRRISEQNPWLRVQTSSSSVGRSGPSSEWARIMATPRVLVDHMANHAEKPKSPPFVSPIRTRFEIMEDL